MKSKKVRALLDHKKFAEELKKLGKTQEEFAEDMDMSDRYVRILSTVDRNVSISLAYALSQAFGVPIEYLLLVVDDEEE
jgi:transcriptional regulator with XRE-family HTH domain